MENMITIILCSYNGKKYIAEQLDSILNQTYKDYKVYVFDDGSTDNTVSIALEYQKRYPERITVTVRKEPTGSACRNFLMALMEAPSSKYYMFSDQDDVWNIDKIERLINKAKHYNEDMPLLIHSDAYVVDEKLNVINESFVRFSGLNPQRVSFNSLLLENQVVGGSVLFNKSLKDMIKLVPEHAIMHDHWLALCASSFGKVVYDDERLYLYRQHEKNEVGAEKGGFIHKLLNRIGNSETVRQNRVNAVTQVEEYLNIYGDELDAAKREALNSFIKLDELPKLKRLHSILKNDFTYANWYQTIGEWILL